MISLSVVSCSDDDNAKDDTTLIDDDNYIGKAVGNFSAEEWYVGGELGTTMNVTAGCYEDETPAVTAQGLELQFIQRTGTCLCA